MKYLLIISTFIQKNTLNGWLQDENAIVHTAFLKHCKWQYLAIFCSFLCIQHLNAQSFYRYQRSGQLRVYAGAGITKYFGELSDEEKLGDLNPHVTLGVVIPLRHRWSFRPELTYYRISAADSDLGINDSRRTRNLSFKSNNLELSGLIAYGLHAKDQRLKISKIKPYLFTGIGLTYFNPTAEFEGKSHSLPPLMTEGVAYRKFNLIIPVGFGVTYKVSKDWQLGMEIGYRFSFTDYLDDVSTNYRDPNSFTNTTAAALADRRPEIGLDKAAVGSPRGNSKTNDGYLLFGLKAFHNLSGSGPIRRKR